jgi:hypothetical protein
MWSLTKRHDPARLTPELAGVTQLEQIPGAIISVKGLDFLWVDFYLGVLVETSEEDGGISESGVSSLWLKQMSYFEPLM